MSPTRQHGSPRDGLIILTSLVLFVAAFAIAPVLAVIDQIGRARARAIIGRATWTLARDLHVDGDLLVLHVASAADAERLPLARISEARVWHIEVVRDFAGANMETYHVLLTLDDGTVRRVEYSEQYPFPFQRSFVEPMRARDILREVRTLRGPAEGLGAFMLYAMLALWCATVAGIAVLTHR